MIFRWIHIVFGVPIIGYIHDAGMADGAGQASD
jgi:hypothetical protein